MIDYSTPNQDSGVYNYTGPWWETALFMVVWICLPLLFPERHRLTAQVVIYLAPIAVLGLDAVIRAH